MYPKFESLTEESEFIVLDNIVFNTSQIKDNILNDFKTKKRNLNFCSKNKFLNKYFMEVNSQGIFNRIEWKFWLKEDIQCELITFDEIKPLEQLQVRIILDFSSATIAIDNTPYSQSSKENNNTENLNLKVLLDYSIREFKAEETPTIDNIETISFKKLYEQNTAYFYPLSSEEICI